MYELSVMLMLSWGYMTLVNHVGLMLTVSIFASKKKLLAFGWLDQNMHIELYGMMRGLCLCLEHEYTVSMVGSLTV